ncbi:MAG: four helix bundle protein [Cephaloticoccus sp.]|nr:four helix bundle protein [Cephaloticoccus sp.]MCF7760974.1 four helix bundle protein [Cephaloticoccus sp.]
MSYQSFEDLEVWQRSRTLVREIYQQTGAYKDWSLRDQMRRAAVSIASNISEGAERNGSAEFQHFIGIAKGSAAELRTQVYLSMDLDLIANTEGQKIVDETKVLGAKLEALRRSLVRRPSPNRNA